MILVEIYMPVIDKKYDFWLEESARVEEVIGTLTDMMKNYLKIPYVEEAGFLLCSMEQDKILPKERTLQMLGIKNGQRLLLV